MNIPRLPGRASRARFHRAALLALLGLALAGCDRETAAPGPAAPAATGNSDTNVSLDLTALRSRIAESIERHRAGNQIPGVAFALVADGDVAMLEGYGVADVGTGDPVSPETTRFRIGSVTKALTGLAVVRLVGQGRVDADAPVSDYVSLPGLEPRFGEPIRVRHLLNHSAGFDQVGGDRRHAASPAERPPLQAFLASELRPVRPPGRVGVYDTYGITLAGRLIEEVTGTTYADHMQRAIFEPLGMADTAVETPSGERAHLATGYGMPEGELRPMDYEYYVTLPASSVDTTAADMAELLRLLLAPDSGRGRSFFGAMGVANFWEPQLPYDDGIHGFTSAFFDEHRHGLRYLHHGGVMSGYEAELLLVPSRNLGFFVAYNRDWESGGPAPGLKEALTDLVLGALAGDATAKAPLPGPAAVDTETFAGAYAGTVGCFTCPLGQGWELATYTLSAPRPGVVNMGGDWHALGGDVFARPDALGPVKFLRDEDGAVRYFVSGPNSYAKLDERLLAEVLGPHWRDEPATRIEAIVYRANERWPEAFRAYAEIAEREPEQGRATFYAGIAALEAGMQLEAAHQLERTIELGQWVPWARYYLAAAQVQAGRSEAGLEELGRALNAGFNDPGMFAHDDYWEPVRNEERFKALVRRIGG